MLVAEAVVLCAALALQGVETLAETRDGLTYLHGLALALGSVDAAPPGIPAGLAVLCGQSLVAAGEGAHLRLPAVGSGKAGRLRLLVGLGQGQEVVEHLLQLIACHGDFLGSGGLTGSLDGCFQFLASVKVPSYNGVCHCKQRVDDRLVFHGLLHVADGLSIGEEDILIELGFC